MFHNIALNGVSKPTNHKTCISATIRNSAQ